MSLRTLAAALVALIFGGDCTQTGPDPDYLPPAPTAEVPWIPETGLPGEPPFVGEPGEDAHGYPLRRPDRLALLDLLRRRRFGRLERFFNHYQEQFEADFRKEEWPDDAAVALSVADEALGPIIDEWIEQSPESYAAFLVRGMHRYAIGWHYRGNEWIRLTSRAQLETMAKWHAGARRDFLRAIDLRPGLTVAHRFLLGLESANGASDAALRARLDVGLEHCRLCYEIRRSYVLALRPRWGGSYPQMDRYAAEVRPLAAENPKLALLAGMSALDRCKLHRGEGELALARKACAAALEVGDDPAFLVARARLLRDQHLEAEALAAVERALRLSPQNVPAIRVRHLARVALGDYLGAARDIAFARRLQPADAWVAGRVEWTVDMLRYQGDRLSKSGDTQAAAPYFALALELAPDDHDLVHRQGWNARDEIDALRAELAERPDDFALHLRLDHALFGRGRVDEIVAMWDAFAVRHPGDPRPLVERAGAKWHMGAHQRAVADMERACDLGMQKACGEIPAMRARLARLR